MQVTFTEPPEMPRWLVNEMPFSRRAARVGGRLVHFVDEGPEDGPAVVMQHGNPTWSYLWRKVIRRLSAQGFRCIAPDLLGLGLSEKLPRPDDHTLLLHCDTISALVEALELPRFTAVGQDWGGPVVCSVAARSDGRADALVLGNTAVLSPKVPIKTAVFHTLSRVPVISDALFYGLNFPVPALPFVQGRFSSIGPRELRAYWWPLRRLTERAAPLGMGRMVPDHESHPSMARFAEVTRWAEGFDGPVSLVWGMKDPILGRAMYRLKKVWPDARTHETEAGHFLQEEVDDLLAAEIAYVTRQATQTDH